MFIFKLLHDGGWARIEAVPRTSLRVIRTMAARRYTAADQRAV